MTARGQTALLGALLALLLVQLAPILWGAMVSLRQPVDAFAVPPRLLASPTFEFHRAIWLEHGFAGLLRNSALVAGFTLAISLPIGCLAGYGLARRPGRATALVPAALLMLRSLPPILLVLPYYAAARWWGLVDTHAPLILAMVAVNQPFVVWLMRGAFRELPPELEAAALVDGATQWQAWRVVLLPAVRPMLAVAALFSLLLTYNEFAFALVLTGRNSRTMPVALTGQGGEDVAYWSLAAAGAIGVMLPALVVAAALGRLAFWRLARRRGK